MMESELVDGTIRVCVQITVEYEGTYRSLQGPIIHRVTVGYAAVDPRRSLVAQFETPKDAIKDAIMKIESVYDGMNTFVAKSGVFNWHNEALKVPDLSFITNTPDKSKPSVYAARDFQQELINALAQVEGYKNFVDMKIKPSEDLPPLNFEALG